MKARILLLVIAAWVLVGCSAVLTVNETSNLSSPSVTESVQYFDRFADGPMYDISMTMPDSWVGNFEVNNKGNAIHFNFLDDGNAAGQFLVIEALSDKQYWQSSGGYPNSHDNIVNLGDTYFVYHLPIDDFFAGMTADELAAFSADVPAIIASFVADAQ